MTKSVFLTFRRNFNALYVTVSNKNLDSRKIHVLYRPKLTYLLKGGIFLDIL
jgi:hypothetical protein